jgi:hypothetical protein
MNSLYSRTGAGGGSGGGGEASRDRGSTAAGVTADNTFGVETAAVVATVAAEAVDDLRWSPGAGEAPLVRDLLDDDDEAFPFADDAGRD